MAKEFAKAFYKGQKWKKCRAAYIAYRQGIDGGMCETCHKKIGKIVHHKIPLTPDNINDPDISLGMANLKYDCMDCHSLEDHGYRRQQVEGMPQYYFSSSGEVVILPPKIEAVEGKNDRKG